MYTKQRRKDGLKRKNSDSGISNGSVESHTMPDSAVFSNKMLGKSQTSKSQQPSQLNQTNNNNINEPVNEDIKKPKLLDFKITLNSNKREVNGNQLIVKKEVAAEDIADFDDFNDYDGFENGISDSPDIVYSDISNDDESLESIRCGSRLSNDNADEYHENPNFLLDNETCESPDEFVHCDELNDGVTDANTSVVSDGDHWERDDIEIDVITAKCVHFANAQLASARLLDLQVPIKYQQFSNDIFTIPPYKDNSFQDDDLLSLHPNDNWMMDLQDKQHQNAPKEPQKFTILKNNLVKPSPILPPPVSIKRKRITAPVPTYDDNLPPPLMVPKQPVPFCMQKMEKKKTPITSNVPTFTNHRIPPLKVPKQPVPKVCMQKVKEQKMTPITSNVKVLQTLSPLIPPLMSLNQPVPLCMQRVNEKKMTPTTSNVQLLQTSRHLISPYTFQIPDISVPPPRLHLASTCHPTSTSFHEYRPPSFMPFSPNLPNISSAPLQSNNHMCKPPPTTSSPYHIVPIATEPFALPMVEIKQEKNMYNVALSMCWRFNLCTVRNCKYLHEFPKILLLAASFDEQRNFWRAFERQGDRTIVCAVMKALPPILAEAGNEELLFEMIGDSLKFRLLDHTDEIRTIIESLLSMKTTNYTYDEVVRVIFDLHGRSVVLSDIICRITVDKIKFLQYWSVLEGIFCNITHQVDFVVVDKILEEATCGYVSYDIVDSIYKHLLSTSLVDRNKTSLKLTSKFMSKLDNVPPSTSTIIAALPSPPSVPSTPPFVTTEYLQNLISNKKDYIGAFEIITSKKFVFTEKSNEEYTKQMKLIRQLFDGLYHAKHTKACKDLFVFLHNLDFNVGDLQVSNHWDINDYYVAYIAEQIGKWAKKEGNVLVDANETIFKFYPKLKFDQLRNILIFLYNQRNIDHNFMNIFNHCNEFYQQSDDHIFLNVNLTVNEIHMVVHVYFIKLLFKNRQANDVRVVYGTNKAAVPSPKVQLKFWDDCTSIQDRVQYAMDCFPLNSTTIDDGFIPARQAKCILEKIRRKGPTV